MKSLPLALIVAGCLGSTPAFALNILLGNDDGYEHANIRALYQALKAQGHTVKIAAPFTDQSARGGAFFFGRAVEVGQDSDPAFPDSYYLTTTEQGVCASAECNGKNVDMRISGTPVMAILMGLKKVMPHPDLVIIGPNPGNNLGAINSASGTFNAASVALLNGVPSLAVSTDLKENNPHQVARLVGQIVHSLDSHRQADGALLPKGVGLNINFPPLAAIKGARLTRIGSYVPLEATYADDIGKLFPAAAGKPGITFQYTPAATAAQQDDEAVWLGQGFVTISPFDATVPAPEVSTALKPLLALPFHP
ncbi:5'-nucleotidase [Pseudomonas sp. JUb42]|uniref:5'/3'-nucleotidase SurE n=1 Tax=Pseudomonas sp. JUb42 TaxID=2940611 RepID=UPI00216810D6|nr:5'/3'-nucleotidase SurE [Pseudomonas sp. JUb42]MCS3468644.1 5'-nucleotidase [Pseudomonas sp. JUb42]